MAFGTITVTESTFGSISGTVIGAIPGTLSGSVGVPGPQGPAGSQGPQGPAGEGVPAGGTTGQALVKTSNTDYATGWTTLNLTQYLEKANNLSDLTNVTTARANLNLGPAQNQVFGKVSGTFGTYDVPGNYFTYSVGSGEYATTLQARNAADPSGTFVTEDRSCVFGIGGTDSGPYGINIVRSTYDEAVGLMESYSLRYNIDDGIGSLVIGGFNLESSDVSSQITITNERIIFPDASVQTTAFPGFNNAALTGNPTAPTPNLSDNDTSIATTAFVKAQGYLTTAPVTSVAGKTGAVTLVVGDVSGAAPLASPLFTGDARAVTAALGDNDTSIATTAFVQQELLSGTANARNLEVYVRNQTGSTIPAGSIVYINGATGNRPTITLAQANNDANSAQTIGFTKTAIANNGFGFVIVRGELENINTSALTEGVQLYLSPTTAGTWTTTKPSAPQHLVYVGVVIRSHPTLGTILVSVQNGYEVAELHDSAISGLADNDLFVYELSTDLWKNKSFATLGLAGLNSPAFTGTPSLPTGTTAVTQTAGNNTTALATTAFVTTSNPDASTTVKGHVELATDLEVIAGTSTTTAIVPAHAGFLKADPRLRSLAALNATAISGSGAVTANSGLTLGREMFLNSLATGRAAYIYGSVGTVGFNTSLANRNQIDFSKKVWMSGYACFGATFSGTAYTGDANTMCRITLGGYSSATTGDMTLRGIGLKKVGGVGSFVTLTVHNGTALTDVATTVAVAEAAGINWVIYSDGTGNVTLYINGVQAATTTAGPTSATGSTAGCYREQVEATATPGVRQVMLIGAGGGWLYLEG